MELIRDGAERASAWRGMLKQHHLPFRIEYISADNDEGGRQSPSLVARLSVRLKDAETAAILLRQKEPNRTSSLGKGTRRF